MRRDLIRLDRGYISTGSYAVVHFIHVSGIVVYFGSKHAFRASIVQSEMKGSHAREKINIFPTLE